MFGNRYRVNPNPTPVVDTSWHGFTEAQFNGASARFTPRDVATMNMTPAQITAKAKRLALRSDDFQGQALFGAISCLGLGISVVGIPFMLIPLVATYWTYRETTERATQSIQLEQAELRERAISVMATLDPEGQGAVVGSYLAMERPPAYGDYPPEYAAIDPNPTPAPMVNSDLPPPPAYTETAVPLTFVRPRENN